MKFENLGFEQMIYQMPSRLVAVESLVRQAGFGDEMVEKLHSGGLHSVPVGDGKPLYHLVNQAVSQLATKIPDFSKRVYGVIFAHSVPLLAPADTGFLGKCLDGSNLIHVPAIAVSGQPCSILHMAVQLAGNWLVDAPDEAGVLLIGADQAYSVKDRIFFGSAMGDVAVAMFLTKNSKQNRVLASISQCDVIATGGEESPSENIARFRSLNPPYIRLAIETCLEEGGVKLEELNFIVPHTPYLMIWDAVSTLIRFPREKILTDYIAETGHLNSNDSFTHYIRAVREEKIRKGDIVLLVNPGFGGTRGCTLLQR